MATFKNSSLLKVYLFVVKMVKIRINFVCEILLLAKAIEQSRVTVCENSEQGYKIITCPENNTISLKSITYGESPCQDANNNRICHSNIDSYFNDHCLGQNNCTLPVGILSKKSCKPPPRRLKVKFECDIEWLWNRHFGYTDTCANSLAEVKCSSGTIRIEDVISYSNAGQCDELTKDSAKDRLEQLCDDKHFCTRVTTKDSWLFHKRYANIYYYCKSPSDPEVTESILGTSSGDQRAVLDLDDNHRVVIYQHSLNRKLYLCSLGWDDNDAEVLCKSLNKKWIGNAKFVDKLSEIPTHPYSMHCDGHESSLLACNFTEDENCCNKTTVAGAVCSQGTGIQAEGVTNPSSNKLSSVKSGFPTLEVALGVPLGIICMICISVAVVLIRRRSVQRNLVIENAEDRTRTGQTSRIQETGLYECTNVTDRSSDHTYDPLESEELNCQFIGPNSHNENEESLARIGETSTIPENYCYESTHVVSRHSDHTYDPI